MEKDGVPFVAACNGHLYKPGIFCEGKEAARGKPEGMGEYMRI